MDNKSFEYNVGEIKFILSRKKVKNINMRIASDGSVKVSANARVSLEYIKAFVLAKQAWIKKAQDTMQHTQNANLAPCPYSKKECLALFTPVFDKIFPLFSDILNGEKPILKVRLMKTRWGVCAIGKKTITLNMRLSEKPYEALEYVVMHEYAHFAVPNHGKDFHALMAKLMPDYKARQKLLK
ncbi:MAG: SprT-like domain-containing protein [Oscillospiraceae bacterium]